MLKEYPFMRHSTETAEQHKTVYKNRTKKKKSPGMIAISFHTTEPSPCIYWYTITQLREGGGRNFAHATMRTGEGHWTPSQLLLPKTTKQKQNCSEAVLWTPGNKLPQNKQKPLQANNCPKIVPFFISLFANRLVCNTALIITGWLF